MLAVAVLELCIYTEAAFCLSSDECNRYTGEAYISVCAPVATATEEALGAYVVEVELTLVCGRYLGLAETNQPPLCKGRGTTKWWKDCFGRHFRLYKIYSIYDVGNEHCSFLYL